MEKFSSINHKNVAERDWIVQHIVCQLLDLFRHTSPLDHCSTALHTMVPLHLFICSINTAYTQFEIIGSVCVGVTILFWSMFLINPRLLLPGNAENLIPMRIFHAQHTVPGVLLVLECAMKRQESQRSIWRDWIDHLIYGMAYLAVMLIVRPYTKRGFFPYPFMAHLDAKLWVGLLLVYMIFTLLMVSIVRFILYKPAKKDSDLHAKLK
jgi:hypothetical protein